MNRLILRVTFFFMLLIHFPSYANDEVNTFLKNLFNDNTEYVNRLSKQDFSIFKEGQIPRATVVACSDSRIQSDAFHQSPVNDLFFIRNIGNQIATTEGSVEYGIYHLKTPVLLIIGHSHCGAIHAAMGDYSKELQPIQNELNHIKIAKDKNLEQNIVENVHQQVEFAMTKFKDKIDDKSLVVVGTVYDFRDDYHHGHGRLVLVNLNGEKDPAKIKQDPLLKDVKLEAIGAP